MEKFLRLSAGLVVLALVIAACEPSSSESPSASESAEPSGVQEPAALCEAMDAGCVEVPAGEPLTIASALSITGDTAFLGNDSNFGIQVAQEERGQVLGRDVEVLHEDAGCGDAASGQTAAEAIVANPAILGVIGTTCSRTAIPAMPVLEEAGLIMISPSNTAPGLTNPDHEQWAGVNYFRTAYNDKVQGAAVAQFACDELGVETAATIHDGSPYAEQLQQVFVDDFATICGGETLSQDAVNVGDTDFRPLLTNIAANAPDLLFFPIFSPEGPLVTNQSQEIAGLADTILFGADGLKDGAFVKAAGALAEEIGMYFSGPDLNLGDRYETEFLPAYYALSGTETPLAPYHAHGYDAYNILMDAVEFAHVGDDEDGTSYFSKEGIRAYVAALADYDGLTGTLSCDEFGDCGSPYVSIAQLVDGVYTEVYTSRP
jgi:branched-chain amino acid transport system substrate-binding protein